jgi:uncharacterized protein (TIGR02145 family)
MTFTSNLKNTDMKTVNAIIRITGVFLLLISCGTMSGHTGYPYMSNTGQETPKSTQTKTKSTQTTSKSTQTKPKTTSTGSKTTQTKPKTTQTKPKTPQTSSKTTAVKKEDPGTVTIGTQKWAVANLNVSRFRNGDSIPEAKTFAEWVAAGESRKPAWCYFNNDSTKGGKYGKLYNWYAVNDPRELAPAGWAIANDEDWAELARFLGGSAVAGAKMKSNSGWTEGYNGTNESGFGAFPGGYRIENGIFKNFGSIATWWGTSEINSLNARDHYIGQDGSLKSNITPKQRGQSVRCIKR